jgi:hypothetical protein
MWQLPPVLIRLGKTIRLGCRAHRDGFSQTYAMIITRPAMNGRAMEQRPAGGAWALSGLSKKILSRAVTLVA